jgi:hypothetical protein
MRENITPRRENITPSLDASSMDASSVEAGAEDRDANNKDISQTPGRVSRRYGKLLYRFYVTCLPLW